MAKNDFSGEVAVNYEQKCLCVLVLDVSGSMAGKPIEELNKGLQNFYKDIYEDDNTSQRLEISLITFNDRVKTIQEPALVENFTMPTLKAGGSTAMVDAVREAIEKVEARKQYYKSTGQTYYRPWIILMTDGEPDPGQDTIGLANQIKADTSGTSKKYEFLPIGVQGANMDILNQIKGNIPAMSMSEAKFTEFFKWLSNSLSIIASSDNKPVKLDNPKTWMDDYFATM